MALPSRRGNYAESENPGHTEPETLEQKIARLEQQLTEKNPASPPQEAMRPAPACDETTRAWVKQKEPSGQFFKFQSPGDSLEGVFDSTFESEYDGKTGLNAVLLADGKEITIGLTMQLRQYFDRVKSGTNVRIVYKGKIGKMKSFDFYTS